MSPGPIHIIGGGLAGSEAAWQAASMGVPVTIHEMRPMRPSKLRLSMGGGSTVPPDVVIVARDLVRPDALGILAHRELDVAVDLVAHEGAAGVALEAPGVVVERPQVEPVGAHLVEHRGRDVDGHAVGLCARLELVRQRQGEVTLDPLVREVLGGHGQRRAVQAGDDAVGRIDGVVLGDLGQAEIHRILLSRFYYRLKSAARG